MSFTRQHLKNFLLGKHIGEESDLREILVRRSRKAISEGVTLEDFIDELVSEAKEAFKHVYEN